MEDINSSCNFFTWNNKQHGEARVFSKLDRMLANTTWVDEHDTSEVNFQDEGDFDHTPALLTVYPKSTNGGKPFRYFTIWRHSPQYINVVKHA